MRNVNVPVVVPPEKLAGDYANAFRVFRDSNREWFLDFLVYSATDQTATVIARVRVLEEFLPVLRDRLGQVLSEIASEDALIVIPGPGEVQ